MKDNYILLTITFGCYMAAGGLMASGGIPPLSIRFVTTLAVMMILSVSSCVRGTMK